MSIDSRSCCQCHGHPSVDYLSQDFYFGMKAFFHRSYDFQGRLMERAFAEPLQFEPMDGEKKVARLLLVSGKAIDFPESETEGLATRVEEEDKAIAKLRGEFAEKNYIPNCQPLSHGSFCWRLCCSPESDIGWRTTSWNMSMTCIDWCVDSF